MMSLGRSALSHTRTVTDSNNFEAEDIKDITKTFLCLLDVN